LRKPDRSTWSDSDGRAKLRIGVGWRGSIVIVDQNPHQRYLRVHRFSPVDLAVKPPAAVVTECHVERTPAAKSTWIWFGIRSVAERERGYLMIGFGIPRARIRVTLAPFLPALHFARMLAIVRRRHIDSDSRGVTRTRQAIAAHQRNRQEDQQK
jgi:hypothetical protein